MTIEELKDNNWKDEKGNYWNNPELSDWKIYSYGTEGIKIDGKRYYDLPNWFIGRLDNPEDTYTLSNNKLCEILSDNGRTLEEYYSRFILNISEVPKCGNPGCNNKVHVRDGKIWRLLTKNCSRSCHISVRNAKLWKDPNYIMNSPEFKAKKSAEMTNNLKKWNHDPEFQAKASRGTILNNEGEDYIFYMALTESGRLKIGVSMTRAIHDRVNLQRCLNSDNYITFHKIFEADNITMANFEFNVKKEFGYQEYIPWEKLNDVISVIKKLLKEIKSDH